MYEDGSRESADGWVLLIAGGVDEPAGQALMTETIQDVINFRKAMASVARRLSSAEDGSGWFFAVFQPDSLRDVANEEVFRFEDAPDTLLSQSASCWALKAGEPWHGSRMSISPTTIACWIRRR